MGLSLIIGSMRSAKISRKEGKKKRRRRMGGKKMRSLS